MIYVIALDSNCQGVIIRGQDRSPMWKFSWEIVQGAIARQLSGGNFPSWELSEGAVFQGAVVRGGGIVLGGIDLVPSNSRCGYKYYRQKYR